MRHRSSNRRHDLNLILCYVSIFKLRCKSSMKLPGLLKFNLECFAQTFFLSNDVGWHGCRSMGHNHNRMFPRVQVVKKLPKVKVCNSPRLHHFAPGFVQMKEIEHSNFRPCLLQTGWNWPWQSILFIDCQEAISAYFKVWMSLSWTTTLSNAQWCNWYHQLHVAASSATLQCLAPRRPKDSGDILLKQLTRFEPGTFRLQIRRRNRFAATSQKRKASVTTPSFEVSFLNETNDATRWPNPFSASRSSYQQRYIPHRPRLTGRRHSIAVGSYEPPKFCGWTAVHLAA